MGEPIGHVEVTHDGTRDVVRIVGEIDVSNVEAIARDLGAALAGDDPEPVVDLTAMRYLDSTGIRMLFRIATRLRTRRRGLRIVAPSGGIVRRALELVELGSVATIDDAPPGDAPSPPTGDAATTDAAATESDTSAPESG